MAVRLLAGDCLAVLRSLPEECVQCVVTSPPYYGLRDYGTASWEGGDLAGCDHIDRTKLTSTSRLRADGREHVGPYPGEKAVRAGVPYRDICGRCGAVRVDQQIGLEATPGEYVARLVEVFREVRRVLRSDGVAWLNLGDSYHNYRSHMNGGQIGQKVHDRHWHGQPAAQGANRATRLPGLKEKDLIGIPWRVAFALQEDGWYLRRDVIWAKPNPMPESVTDRPTTSHEYLFMLTRAPGYFWDAEAVREPDAGADHPRNTVAPFDGSEGFLAAHSGIRTAEGRNGQGRNLRSVWTIATRPYSGAHFATMPPDLVEICVKAASRPGDVVLDPFGGAGTTALVADRLGRDALLIELNPAYVRIAEERLRADAGMFLAIAAQ